MRYFLRSVVKAAHPIGRCRRRLWAICVVLSPAVRAARRAAVPKAAATIAPMNGIVGWVLVVAAFAAGWRAYGWPGFALAATVVVFCLLLQFSRAMRVMRRAAGRPVGQVDHALEFNARLKRGMTMLQIVSMTGSLGRPVAGQPATWAWNDSDATVTLVMAGDRLERWSFARTGAAAPEEAASPPA
jgi:hypothetical protein